MPVESSRRSRGLGSSLLRQSLMLALVPLLLLGAVTYLVASRSLESRIREYLEEQAFQISASVDETLSSAATDADTWASLSVFRGAFIYGSYDKVNEYLEDFSNAYPRYRAIHLFDRNGDLVATSSAESAGAVSAEDLAAALIGERVASGVSRNKDRWSVFFGAPVLDGREQRVTGALFVELDWDRLLRSLDDAESHAGEAAHDSYRIFLVDAARTLVGHRDRSAILEVSLPPTDLLSKALAGGKGSRTAELTDETGELVVGYASFAGLGGSESMGACLVTESAAAAFAPIYRIRLIFVAIAVLAAGAAFVLSRRLTRLVVRPVEAAAMLAKAIADGELPEVETVSAGYELSDLMASLNRMTSELRQVASLAHAIAAGHLPETLAPRSQQDRLRYSLSRMTDYLKQLTRRAERIADGDLTERIGVDSDEDVLGNAFESMVENLHQLLTQVKTVADEAASTSVEIAASAEESARNGEEATRSAARLLETISTMSQSIGRIAGRETLREGSSLGQMSDSIRSNLESVEQLVSVARIATESTGAGRIAMETASDAMTDIGVSITSAVETVTALGARAENIGEIVLVIEDIAEQTNLLALNAAIEAARAGEHGSGFAVVADEVRKLAERSATSASEIATLIRDIDDRVRSAVSVMTNSKFAVDEGITRTGEVAKTLHGIDKVVVELNALTKSIETATSRQAEGAAQIAESANTLHSGSSEVFGTTQAMQAAVQQNAASSSQLAQSAQGLSDQVERLHQLLSRFRLAADETAPHPLRS